jgi:hypothetical protein
MSKPAERNGNVTWVKQKSRQVGLRATDRDVKDAPRPVLEFSRVSRLKTQLRNEDLIGDNDSLEIDEMGPSIMRFTSIEPGAAPD